MKDIYLRQQTSALSLSRRPNLSFSIKCQHFKFLTFTLWRFRVFVVPLITSVFAVKVKDLACVWECKKKGTHPSITASLKMYYGSPSSVTSLVLHADSEDGSKASNRLIPLSCSTWWIHPQSLHVKIQQPWDTQQSQQHMAVLLLLQRDIHTGVYVWWKFIGLLLILHQISHVFLAQVKSSS